jgi:hypothetical protein
LLALQGAESNVSPTAGKALRATCAAGLRSLRVPGQESVLEEEQLELKVGGQISPVMVGTA